MILESNGALEDGGDASTLASKRYQQYHSGFNNNKRQQSSPNKFYSSTIVSFNIKPPNTANQLSERAALHTSHMQKRKKMM